MTLLLAAVALATDRPVLGDEPCEPRGVRAGVAVTYACDGVLVSSPRAAWMASMVAWGDEQAALRELDTAAHADALDAERARTAYWQAIAQRPAPVEPPPAVWLGVGVGAGVALSLGTAWAWGVVAGAH